MIARRTSFYVVCSHKSHQTINVVPQLEKFTKLISAFNLDLSSLRTFPIAVTAPVFTRGSPQIVLRF